MLFEENSTLPLPERLEAPGVKSVWGEVSQESPKNRRKKNLENRPINRPLYLVRPLTRRAVVFKCVDTPLRTCLARLVGCRANNWFSVLRHSFSVKRLRDGQSLVYSAVIITCVHYLGPPGPLFRDILEVHTNHRRKKETDSNTTQLFVGIKLRADKRTVCKEPLETAWRVQAYNYDPEAFPGINFSSTRLNPRLLEGSYGAPKFHKYCYYGTPKRHFLMVGAIF